MKGRILLLEDDTGWVELYEEKFDRLGWAVTHTDIVPEAIHQLQLNDRHYDIVVADKGGTNGLLGGSPDKYGHRDGLAVLRTSFELYPETQLRVLSTGESWSKTIFDDPTLGLHAFHSKGFGDLGALTAWMDTAIPSHIHETKLFIGEPRRRQERW